MNDALRWCDGLFSAAQFIRNVRPLMGRSARHVAQGMSQCYILSLYMLFISKKPRSA